MSPSGYITISRFSLQLCATGLLLFKLVTAQAGTDSFLQQYVNKPDPAYRYQLVNSVKAEGYTNYLIAIDSQHWRQANEVNRTLWTHWLHITIPAKVTTKTAMLVISGGDNSRTPPDLMHKKFQYAAYMARASNSIVATLRQVPNQPLLFSGSNEALREDSLIAYSWKKAMDSGDYRWHAYLPMVKSAVRAMDTIQAFVAHHVQLEVERFVVTGFSKRGAVTWLTAAVDPRVCAISPGVFDVLNYSPSLAHHFASYGFYSSAIDDYVKYGVIKRLQTSEGRTLQKLIDPYHYVKLLDLPIFIINSSGDEFFPADSARFYFDNLPADRLIRYIPNTDHSLNEAGKGIRAAIVSLLNWYRTIVAQQKRPLIRWQQQNNQLTVSSDLSPSVVRLWQATNSAARDFRLETTGRVWQSKTLSFNARNEYRVSILPPDKGWTAYFIELQYGRGIFKQTYTSRIFITPAHLPYKPD